MTTAFDVPAESLISAVSKELKENDKINETVYMVFKPVIIAAPNKEYKNIFFLYSSFFSPINIPQNIQHINVSIKLPKYSTTQ